MSPLLSAAPQTLQPPVAVRLPHPTHIHGVTLDDDYFWLRDKESQQVRDYLLAENAYTDAVLEQTKDLQESLYREMLSHIKETDTSVPYRDGDWFYLTHTVEGSQYAIYARRRAVEGRYDTAQPEEVLLDVNQLAAGEAYMALGALSVSSDGNLLAYTTDNTGFRQYTLHVKDLRTGQVLPDTAERVGALVWAPDNCTLLYTVEDEQTKRHDRVLRHVSTRNTMCASMWASAEHATASTCCWASKAIPQRSTASWMRQVRPPKSTSWQNASQTRSTMWIIETAAFTSV